MSFLDVRQHGVRARTGVIGVAFVPHGDSAPAQIGYAVSRRVGNAVARNRVRRQLRAALSELTTGHEATLRGGSYVITPRPGATDQTYADLRSALRVALGKAQRRADIPGTHVRDAR